MLPTTLKPGIVPLAPMNVGSVLGGAFSMYKFNPAAMIALPLLLLGILALIGAPLGYLASTGFDTFGDPIDIGTRLAPSLLGLAVLSLTTSIVVGFIASSVRGAVLGRKLTPAEVWAATRGRIPAIVGYAVMLGLAMAAVIAVCLLPFTWLVLDVAMQVIGMLVGTLVFCVLWFWLSTKLLLAPVAIVLEGLGPFAAIRRSFQLTRGAFWPILGTYLLASLIVGLVQQVVGGAFSLAITMAAAFGEPGQQNAVTSTLMVPVVFLLLAIVLPFSNAVITLIYLDRRIKTEAYDVELIQQAYPMGAPTAYQWGPPQTFSQPPHDPNGYPPPPQQPPPPGWGPRA
jgi:hypothetical protein